MLSLPGTIARSCHNTYIIMKLRNVRNPSSQLNSEHLFPHSIGFEICHRKKEQFVCVFVRVSVHVWVYIK